MKIEGVICGVDVNDFDQAVVDTAATFAQHFNQPLHLIHVTVFPDPTNLAWPAYLGSPNKLIEEHRLLREIGTQVEGVQVRHHHLSGDPKTRLIEFANSNQPSLLVLGTHARKGIARVFGSVATRVLRHVECPVMVLRQRQNSQQHVESKPKAI